MSKIHYISKVETGIVYEMDGKTRTRMSQRTACGIYDYYVNLVTEKRGSITCKKCQKALLAKGEA